MLDAFMTFRVVFCMKTFLMLALLKYTRRGTSVYIEVSNVFGLVENKISLLKIFATNQCC